MVEKEEASDQLIACLKQKLILLTKISDITKQIEVQSSQKEIELGDLPDQRQIYIDRLKKCQQVIADSYRSMDQEQQSRRKKIFSGDFAKEECTEEEAELLEYAVKCRDILNKTLAMDVEARRLLQKECDRLQNLLHTARNSKNTTYSNKYH